MLSVGLLASIGMCSCALGHIGLARMFGNFSIDFLFEYEFVFFDFFAFFATEYDDAGEAEYGVLLLG